MLARQRREQIAESVARDGSARVRDLAEVLGVSEITIRRDLDMLASSGLIEKVHGGATRVAEQTTDEPGFDAKQLRQRAEKEAIARAAARMVAPGSAIALSAGTTTWALAHRLLEIPELTVVTNSPTVAQVLYASTQPRMSVVLTGGVRTPSDALVGPVATNSLTRLHVDVVFMGVHGMDISGFSTPNLAEAEVNQALLRAARKRVVVADHTKWGVQGLATIAPLGEASVLISDPALSPDARAAFDDGTTELVIADDRALVASG